jgi:N-acetylneuraminic acid mutarotase
MHKFIVFIMFFMLISGSFLAVVSFVSAAGLVADSWNAKTPMAHARTGVGVIAADNKIYAIGGYETGNYVGTNECYDPATDTWVTLTAMPTPRSNFAIVSHDGKIYCIGGSNGIGVSSGMSWFGFSAGCSVNEVYDIAADTWSTRTDLPINGIDLRASVVDGKIFIINDNDLYMYEPATDSWIQKTGMDIAPIPRALLVSAVVDDKIVVTGEFYLGDNSHAAKRVMIYDPKTDTWNQGSVSYIHDAHVRTGGTGGATGVTSGLYAPQRAYFLEYTYDYFYNTTFHKTEWSIHLVDTKISLTNRVYDPASDTWSTAKPMPTQQTSFGVAVIDDILYVIGETSNYQYVPIGYHAPSKGTSEFLNYMIAITLALTVGMVTTVLLLYLKKREDTNKNRVKLLASQ